MNAVLHLEFLRRDRVFDFLVPKVADALDITRGVLLYMEGVNKSFDGFKAINDLNLYIHPGELRCVIGANGAGKTTMMDIITGKTKADTGTLWFGSSINLTALSEADIALAGIARKFQKPTVFEALSVAENLELALAGDRRVRFVLLHELSGEDWSLLEEVACTVGLQDKLSQRSGELSHGQKQWLEIGMLLVQQPQLLLIDEPVAGMTHQEMEKTGELLTRLAGKHTVVVVEHDMDFIRSIAKTVTVLHQGSVLAEGSMAAIQQNEEVRRVYLGE